MTSDDIRDELRDLINTLDDVVMELKCAETTESVDDLRGCLFSAAHQLKAAGKELRELSTAADATDE